MASQTFGLEESDEEVQEADQTGKKKTITRNSTMDINTSLDLDMSLLVATHMMPEIPLDLSWFADQEEATRGSNEETGMVLTALKKKALENLPSQNTATQSTLDETQTNRMEQISSFSTTLKQVRLDASRFEKRKIWQDRLSVIQKEIRNVENKKRASSKNNAVLLGGIKFLGSALRNWVRPDYLHDILDEYAVSVVVLGELLSSFGSEEFERGLPRMLKSLVSVWLRRGGTRLSLMRAWHHTERIVSRMLHRITSVRTLFAIEHTFASMLSNMSVAPDEADDMNARMHACNEIHGFLTRVNQRLASVFNFAP